MTIKTKTAAIGFAGNKGKVTCTYNGEKDVWGKAIWRDENGNPYELMYARLSKKYAFTPIERIILKEVE